MNTKVDDEELLNAIAREAAVRLEDAVFQVNRIADDLHATTTQVVRSILAARERSKRKPNVPATSTGDGIDCPA
jgi:hypothetical protein